MKFSSIDFFGATVTYRMEHVRLVLQFFFPCVLAMVCTSMVQDVFITSTRDVFVVHLRELGWRSMRAC